MEAIVPEDALATLEALPGLTLHQGARSDRLDLVSAAGTTPYLLRGKSTVTTSSLPALLQRLGSRGSERRPLLLAPYLTPAVTERLVEEGIEFADAAGNVHLDGPAAYVLVLGRRLEKASLGSGLSRSDLRLAFALLARPALRNATYRELHEAAGISLGAVSNGVRRLKNAGHVHRRARRTVLRDPASLLERWEYGYLEQLRPRLNPAAHRFGKSATLTSLARAAMEIDGVRIGGEVAADAMTRHLRPNTLTLHVPAGQGTRIARDLRLPPARGDEADVVLLERFSPAVDTPAAPRVDAEARLIHPILIRVELLAFDDARLREVAERLLRDVILPELTHAE